MAGAQRRRKPAVKTGVAKSTAKPTSKSAKSASKTSKTPRKPSSRKPRTAFGRWMRRGGKRVRSVKKFVVTVVAAVIAAVFVFGMGVVVYKQMSITLAKNRQAKYVRQYDFDPGNIISDTQFFNTKSMGTYEVQQFLDKHGAKCSGDLCLKNYTVTTLDEKADRLCDGYKGGQQQSAAQVIDGAARSCGISQKVLLVMLEKEQGLVSTTTPSEARYKAALGLSCPDDGPCDPKHGGFFNQVYGAARRFKYYQAHESMYNFHAGQLNYVQYHPQSSCGGANVWIENDATALLYIYTPYQPNVRALQAGLGEGDSCSSYGNRNFSILYDAWFGDPRAS
ncbi:hemagglutinin [Bifidobacterium sp. 82T24]|nr:hemagglutinin [Bifidobacterium pluvialisilvae]